MSFNTFCGQDPTVVANYQKLLLQFQELQTLDYTQVDIQDTQANATFFPLLTNANGTGQRALFSDDGGFLNNPIRLNPITSELFLGYLNYGISFTGATDNLMIGANGAIFNGTQIIGIGTGANSQNAGNFSIGIGDVANNNSGGIANSIVLNASGNVLNSNGNGRLHISGLRGLPTPALGGLNELHYNPLTSELFYSTTP